MDEQRYGGDQGNGRRRLVCALLLSAVIAAAPGCARARAKALPLSPPLDVPPPPPRIVLPLEAEAAPAPLPESSTSPEEPRRPQAPPRARAAVPADTAKPVEEPPKAVTPPPPPPSAPVLQTTPAAAQGEVERGIRSTMAKASADLSRTDYRALTAGARTQYDTAKRFVQQAEEAIAMKNLPFAKNLADKAAVLAAQLAPR